MTDAVAPSGARVGVVTFPGSLDDRDAARAVRLAGAEPVALWHGDADLAGVDAVVLPGRLLLRRLPALRRDRPLLPGDGEPSSDAARGGMPVLGICNGFQVLAESHLLPGALTRNAHLRFRSRPQWLEVTDTTSAWTRSYEPGAHILVPLKSGEGRYVADERTLDELEGEGRVVVRYVGTPGDDTPGNPNGSMRDIAGVRNAAGNVVGPDAAPRARRRGADRPVHRRPGLLRQRAVVPPGERERPA